MKKQLFSFLLVLTFVFSASAQKAKQSKVEKNLRKHVSYLASDQLEGRKTGERGGTQAAGYVVNMFARYKLKPGYSDVVNGKKKTSFLQPFEYVSGVELGENNSFTFHAVSGGEKESLKIDNEWKPVMFSSSGTLEKLPVIFVGYGITSERLNYDNYRGIKKKDYIALAVDGIPDTKFSEYAPIRQKAIMARENGAKALILVTDLQDKRYVDLKYDNQGDAGIPVVIIDGQAMSKTHKFAIPRTGTAAVSSDGTDTSYDDETVITTKPNGETTVEKPDGTTFKYKVRKRREGDAVYTERVDGKTTIKNPNGTVVELEEDYLFPTMIGRAEDFTASINVELTKTKAEAYNVIGIIEGRDPQLKNEAIVIGAHYDHLGRGGRGSLAPNSNDIHNGADDNASGTSALLELARQFRKAKKNKRTLIFIAFGAEESGLIGSKYYVNNPVFPIENTVAMINMDMVGRLNNEKLTVGGIGTASEFEALVKQLNADSEISHDATKIRIEKTSSETTGETGTVVTAPVRAPLTASIKSRFDLQLNQDGFGPSDHSSFYGKQIPVLFFFTGTHSDYHKPSDDSDKINYEGLEKITEYVSEIVKTIDQNLTRPTYTKAKSSQMMGGRRGFNVSLGTIPSYGDSANDGLVLDGVRDGSPADKAGIRGGDKVIRIADREIRNISDYMFMLGEMKPGETYDIVVMRDGKKVDLKIVPDARK